MMRKFLYLALGYFLWIDAASAQNAGLIDRLEALEERMEAAERRDNALSEVLMKSTSLRHCRVTSFLAVSGRHPKRRQGDSCLVKAEDMQPGKRVAQLKFV